MALPSPSDYVEAAQFPEVAFTDPELAAGEVETNPLGLPRVITGAYAAVFRVTTGERSWAVRCFLAAASHRQQRYRALTRHLEGLDDHPLIRFDYQGEGIRVDGRQLPVLKMPWLEGSSLDAYVERHLDRPDVLLALRDRWRELIGSLEKAQIAHADLQHGNVLVRTGSEGPEVSLVDYDAVWVPSMGGRPSPEVGHRNYQHPDRTETDVGLAVDRFPALVIYLALTALAERPELWERFSTGENLLFQSNDFYDPASSALFDEVRRLPQSESLARALERMCLLKVSQSRSLEQILGGEEVPRPRSMKRTGRDRQEEVYRRTGFARAAVPALLSGVALAIIVGWLASAGAGVLVALLVVGLFLGGALRGYRSEPVVRRRHRLLRERGVLLQWIRDLEDEVAEIERERDAFVERATGMADERLRELRDEALHGRLKYHFIGELSDDRKVGHRAVVRLKGAGVRTAFQATPERVAAVKDLASRERARIREWRDELAQRYQEHVPTELSPAEEQRLRRLIERRLEEAGGELARVRQKADLQRAELRRVEAQLEGVDELSLGRYVRYLLRMAPPLRRYVPGVDASSPPPRREAEADPEGEGAWWRAG